MKKPVFCTCESSQVVVAKMEGIGCRRAYYETVFKIKKQTVHEYAPSVLFE